MIKNIIFDIGNVLVDYCWREHVAGFGFDSGMVERIGKAMMLSPTWNELDKGVWTDEQLLAGFIANDPEIEKEIRLVFSDFSTIVRQHPGSIPWIHDLKAKGYKVYYLSNYARRARMEGEAQLTFMAEMDGGIMSYEIQKIKPGEEIYRHLFAKYDLIPEECVFLDDSPANIETGKRLGMYGILVSGQEQAMQELETLLGQVNA